METLRPISACKRVSATKVVGVEGGDPQRSCFQVRQESEIGKMILCLVFVEILLVVIQMGT